MPLINLQHCGHAPLLSLNLGIVYEADPGLVRRLILEEMAKALPSSRRTRPQQNRWCG